MTCEWTPPPGSYPTGIPGRHVCFRNGWEDTTAHILPSMEQNQRTTMPDEMTTTAQKLVEHQIQPFGNSDKCCTCITTITTSPVCKLFLSDTLSSLSSTHVHAIFPPHDATSRLFNTVGFYRVALHLDETSMSNKNMKLTLQDSL
ncbi:hypothetical protein NPIL_154641 [Nephila pilipes]|uniref:Uncharacterized protein n=1 Tax=Nephila pilipes TaxID=299642 RepID=A0A8X6PY23_NEPPI|nr:hypothetical protein NPIL_154641 [Nephila pilipes]